MANNNITTTEQDVEWLKSRDVPAVVDKMLRHVIPQRPQDVHAALAEYYIREVTQKVGRCAPSREVPALYSAASQLISECDATKQPIFDGMCSTVVPTRFCGHRLGSPLAPIVIECWLNYLCGPSRRTFKRMTNDVIPWVKNAYPNKVQFIFRHQIQPWWPQCVAAHEAALVVDKLNASQFYTMSHLLFDTAAERLDNWDATRMDMYRELADMAAGIGVDRSSFLAVLARKEVPGQHNTGNGITDDVRWFVKLSRQQGVHASPTFIFNGIVNDNISSSWSVDQWKEMLMPLLS